MIRKIIILFCLIFFTIGIAKSGDIYIPDAYLNQSLDTNLKQEKNFTIINKKQQQQTQYHSNQEIKQIIDQLNIIRHTTKNVNEKTNATLEYLINQFKNRPYLLIGAEGEGGKNQHIKQDPIYRTNGFDCSTLVQTVLALLHADSYDDFQKKIVEVQYGAASLPANNAIHYCNRNNFASKDFNKINYQHGYIKDVTETMNNQIKTKFATTKINPRAWLEGQAATQKLLQKNIRVFNYQTGHQMAHRFTNMYQQTFCPKLTAENITLNYIPKMSLVKKAKGRGAVYLPREDLINKLPEPSIVEIVRDDNLWWYNGAPIKKKLNTGILISHMGFLHKQIFRKDQLIYQKIECQYKKKGHVCEVTPIYCKDKVCAKLMFTHATDAYPDDYYFYHTNNHYYCTAKKPKAGTIYTYCNRVMSMPLGDYLAQDINGRQIYLKTPSILGLNIQKLLI